MIISSGSYTYGIGQQWVIRNSFTKLSIYRNGGLVFEAKGYDNASKVFDGHSNKTGFIVLKY